MKRIIFMLVLAMSAGALFAQSVPGFPMTKKEKRKAEQEKQYQLNKEMLENRDFVLEADYLQNKYGHRFLVNSNINFVAVDSTTAIIQIGSDYRVGANGVGGVTAKGKITRWVLKENTKQKTFYLSINVMTPIGIYDLHFSIDSSGRATAMLSGLSPGELTFEGNMVPYSESAVYEGMSL